MMIYPGATVGIIGGHESGLALATEAKSMGFNTAIYTDSEDDVALGLADFPFVGRFNDGAYLQQFIDLCQVVTYTDVPIVGTALEVLQEADNVPQQAEILAYTQDRTLERAFLSAINVNLAPYATVLSVADISREIEGIGFPAVIKPNEKGYGPKYQHVIYEPSDIPTSESYLQNGTYILESWIPYERELSIIATRSRAGKIVTLPIIENQYFEHTLLKSILPARIQATVATEVVRLAHLIGDKLNYIGSFGLEFFLTSSGALYVKRIVIAPHISGAITQNTLSFSQYSSHMRAICDWSMPAAKMITPGVSMSVLGQMTDQINTQVQIKPDWHFYFADVNNGGKNDRIGFVNLTGPDTGYLLEQIDNTGIWAHIKS